MAVIKICGINGVEDAITCAEESVDYIGIHVIKDYPEREKIEIIKRIRLLARVPKVTLVTKIKEHDKLVSIIKLIKWDAIQLHYRMDVSECKEYMDLLSIGNTRPEIILAVQVDENSDKYIYKIREYADILLLDSSWIGGTGVASNNRLLKRAYESATGMKVFIAGGVNANNIKVYMRKYSPYGFDIQTAARYSMGNDRISKNKIREIMREMYE